MDIYLPIAEMSVNLFLLLGLGGGVGFLSGVFPHQVLVQHNSEVTGSLTHLLERIAAAPEQVDQSDAL
jgi:hypothetical protein